MKKMRGQGITQISNLFKKYTYILKPPQKTIILTFIEVVNEILGITLQEKQCSYSIISHTLKLHISGVVKTEIILNKKKILMAVGVKIGLKNNIKEII